MPCVTQMCGSVRAKIVGYIIIGVQKVKTKKKKWVILKTCKMTTNRIRVPHFRRTYLGPCGARKLSQQGNDFTCLPCIARQRELQQH